MKLIGLRLCEHDSNISYFDGQDLHYLKTERHYQVKHHAFKDLNSWKQLVKDVWNVDVSDIDDVCIIVDPSKHNINHDLDGHISKPFGHIQNILSTRINHHYAHALSAWMMTGSSTKQIIIDGFGDEDIAWTVFDNFNIVDVGSVIENGSLGINMSTVGYNFGIKNCHGLDIAGKLMGLQSYGNLDDRYLELVSEYGIKQSNDIFDFNKWISYKKDPLLAELTKLDWIKTIHEHIGNKLVEFFSEYANDNETIIYSGGVAQNVLWNTKLKNKFPNLIIPPHCNDEGLSLGAIEWLRIKHNLPKFSLSNFPYIQSDFIPPSPSRDCIEKTARLLSDGKIVAWYQGNGEVGPRALGNRSILMDPRDSEGKYKINCVKNREFYRPFGASVLRQYKDQYFKMLPDNPHMLYVGMLHTGLFPAITHVDGTCRAQTVDSESLFGELLTEFHNLTGCAMLLNTSLNLAGKPIAGYKQDALTLLKETSIDALVIGNIIYLKDEQQVEVDNVI